MPEVQARYYEVMNHHIVCGLCPHHCRLKPGQAGICRVRVNHDNCLFTLNYGEITSLAIDPVEKKPLYHFFPGKKILSVGTFGCNLKCGFCQNYTLAHGNPPSQTVNPDLLAHIAEEAGKHGSIGVAFTYNEPSIWFEYVMDAAAPLRQNHQKIVLVTNGFIEKRPLQELLEVVDAFNIDIKANTPHFYKKYCQGQLAPVKKSVEIAAARAHVEVTNLIIPGQNDKMEEIGELAKWLASLNPNIPLHLSRYYPAYKYSLESTPEDTMHNAFKTAREYLNCVYLGNMTAANNTFCNRCNNLLIERNYYNTEFTGMQGNQCRQCGAKIDYIINR
ncbi:MAG: AmmeMemoRadiSam system radical SAM enzyme [Syntrophomonadaceae bacterium]|jgi:pyruvate formate lyase activating enzyme